MTQDTRIRPTRNYVLCRLLPEEDRQTPGGLYRPASADMARRCRGVVVAKGSAPEFDDLQTGDILVWGRYGKREIELDGEIYAFLPRGEVEAALDAEMSAVATFSSAV